MALLPVRVSAVWPFSSPAGAASVFEPLVHDTTIALLAAAIHSDPNPTKGVGEIPLSEGSALLAESGPGGTLVNVASSTPSSDQISLYVVRSGDTLSDISRMFGVSISTIVWANNLGSSRTLRTGQQLVILPVSGVEHTVVKGDTLASIAKKFKGDADEIADFNGLDSSEALVVGTKVIVPGGEIAVPVTARVATVKANPYRGGSGSELAGFFSNPLPGAAVTQRIHGWNGIDLGAPRGSTIYAAGAGTVIVSRNNGAWNGGYGNYVVISHANGVQTLYSHMSRTAVTVGQTVTGGQPIGYVGTTGQATGPHLHFEVRGAANPFAFCPLGAVCQPQ